MGPEFWLYFAVGFAAQLVDGALGMAYGVVTTTVLLAGGVTPANASASVHAAKVFTGAASAISHIAHRNVDWRLLVLLSIGGVVGGVIGTYILTSVDGDAIKPYVVGWLGLMGLVILYRAWKGARPKPFSWKSPLPLGLTGGFFDAVGGGGWVLWSPRPCWARAPTRARRSAPPTPPRRSWPRRSRRRFSRPWSPATGRPTAWPITCGRCWG